MVVGETHHFRNPPHDGHLKITCDSHGKPLDGFPRIVCVLKAHLQGDGRGGYLWESMAYGRLSFRGTGFSACSWNILKYQVVISYWWECFSEIHSIITSSWSWDPTPQQKYVLKRVDSFFFLGRQGRSSSRLIFMAGSADRTVDVGVGETMSASPNPLEKYVFLGNIHQSTIISHLFPKKNHAL